MIAEENGKTMPFLHTFFAKMYVNTLFPKMYVNTFFAKMYRRGVINSYLQILLFDYSPQ